MPKTIVTRAQNGLLSSPDPQGHLEATCEFSSFQKRCHGFGKPFNCCSISRLTYKEAQFKCESEV
jgi:hypothetical protein